ncbi:hypothetical protein FOC4_g10003380 [Fusarium odoratissimum]|uniref:Zn(2)-C6 fungal-type domain-containing protein n=1 Tax=Fusarium oxysporum f. sp. cubense (strain race 4) TaxID=2502994 RepID=N1RW52_FUSC4|nr:hypothetical protein FOC4_g10003380 [Fusarium odoratissimum]
MQSQAHTQDDASTETSRTNKRTRLDPQLNATGRDRSSGAQPTRRRVAVACKVCRSRKTKCDSRWPVCSYCEKSNSECRYDTVDSADRPFEADSLVNLTATPQSIPAPEGHVERFSEGLDRILTWNVFPQEIDPIPVDDGSLMAMPDEIPPISFPELKRLQKCYLSTVHSVNPILDVVVLDQYWSVACKRLGRAMSHNTLESAQCLCLEVFYDGRKLLLFCNMGQVVAHSEIRYEIPSLPGSMLEHIEDRLTFPSPPAANCLFDETIAWYYFLADIAARHLINRIVDAKVEISGCPSEVQARTLLRSYEVFGSQLQDWYLSLPPEISFPPPDATISPESNIYKRILRSRYLFIKELLCRPFVRLCLNYDLELPSALDDEIVSIASLGLQYCAWRLKAVDRMNKLDHGLWIWIRNSTACSMILIGAARSLQFHSVTASKRLVLPQDWREIVVSFLHGLEKYSHETRGGVAACYRLVTWGLDGFQPSSPDII